MLLTKRQLKALAIFRPRDCAVVINPVVVTRAGYPLALEDLREELGEKYRSEIASFVKAVGLSGIHSVNDNILTAIARAEMVKRRFGGNKRTLHTETIDKLMGQRVEVLDKKVVKTGTYSGAKIVGGWDYGEEYDPPELSNAKSHVLVEIQTYTQDHFGLLPADSYWIEARNLRKVYDDATRTELGEDGLPTNTQ